MTAPFTFFPDDALDPTKPRARPEPRPTPQQPAPGGLFFRDEGAGASQLRQAARLGSAQAPDSAARVLALQTKTGLPPDLIARNLDTIEAETKRASFNAAAFRQQSPIVAAWLAQHPTYYAAAQDDLDALSGLERVTTAIRRGVRTGRSQMRLDRLSAQQREAGGYLAPGDRATMAALEQQLAQEPGGSGFVRQFLYPAAKIIGQQVEGFDDIVRGASAGMMTGAIAGASTGGVLLPITVPTGIVAGAVFGATQNAFISNGGSSYRELGAVRDANGQPLPEDVRRNVSLGVGALSAALEIVGEAAVVLPFKAAASKLIRGAARDALVRPTTLGALARFGKEYLVGIAGETSTEVAQEIVQVAGEELAKWASNGQFRYLVDDPDQREIFVERLAAVAEETAKAMSLLALPGPSTHGAVDVARARQAARREQHYAEIFGLRRESKTDQRNPDAVDEILTRATEGTPVEQVYLDVEPFQEYFQEQGKDPRDVARELWGNTTEYDQAVQTGGMMALPTPRFTRYAARSEDHQFFAREWRRTPDDMNGREAAEVLSQPEATATDAATDASTDAAPAATPAGPDVEQILTERLEATGRYRSGDASTLVSQLAAFLRTMGTRAGVDPMVLLERYGITITPGTEQRTQQAQPTTAEGAPVEADTQVDTPVDPEADVEAAAERAAIQAEALAAQYATPRRDRDANAKTEAGTYAYARTAGGALRANLARVSVEGLVDEYLHLLQSNSEDAGGAELQLRQDENFHSTEHGGTIQVATEGMAHARGRIAAREKSLAKVEAELRRRGVSDEEIGRQMLERSERESEDVSFGPADGEFWQSHGPMFRRLARRAGAAEADVEARARALAVRSYEQRDRGPRGRMRIDERTRRVTIDLFESADWSTFLHESGHVYLEVLKDLAGDHEQIASDYAAILKFLGVQASAQIGREHHERFARAAEAYFMEGKAPSSALRRAFHRFRIWLQTKYRTAEALDVQITPAIRDVFGRLFATDAEIEAAESEAQIVPIFTTAEQAGMTEEAFAAYRQQIEDAHIEASDRLRVKLMRERLREQESVWQERREEVRATVADEVAAQPVYVALAALQDPTAPVKLSRADLVERKGAGFLSELPRPFVYAKEGGLSADRVAEDFGFASGDELLNALATAPKLAEAIDAETDRRMAAEFGDMRADGTIGDAAEEAVMNDHREVIIRAELRALHAQARAVRPYVQAERKAEAARVARGAAILRGIPSDELVRRVAQGQISGLKIRDIQPHRYWVVARKASRQAIEATGRKDYVGAANAKQAELLNLALYREAQRVKELAESVVDYAQRLQRPASQQRLGRAGGDYLDQVNKILERFDFRPNLSLTAIDRRAALLRFVQRQQEQDIEIHLPEAILNEAWRTPWKELTPDELEGVRDALRHLDHLAGLKNRLLKQQDQRAFDDAVAETVAAIHANAKGHVPRHIDTVPSDLVQRGRAAIFASHRKLSNILRELDGWKDGGTLWSRIMWPLNEAADEKALLSQEMTQRVYGLFNDAYSKAELAGMYRREFQPAINASISKMGRLMVALNYGAEDNRAKLIAGLSITTGQAIDPVQVENLIDTLDARDMRFVQSIWDMVDSYWPLMQALAERMDGIAPEKIEASPVTTRHGVFRGGYFPLKYDSAQSNVASRNEEAKLASNAVRGAAFRAHTKAGSRHERVENVRLPLRLEFGVIFSHLEELALDLSHTEALYDVNRLLGDELVASAIRDRYGDGIYQQMRNAVRDIAAGDVRAQHAGERAIAWIRSGTSIAAMGWNLTTAALQPLGLTQSMVQIGPKWVGRGLARWLRDASSMEHTAEWIQTRSKFMQTRATTQMREINEIRNRIGMTSGRVSSAADRALHAATGGTLDMKDVTDSFFWFITRMQLVADIPTWLGAYEKAMADPANNEARAVAMADQAVLDSQGGGQIKDLAAVQRGSESWKLFTSFYSFFSVTYNQNTEIIKRTEWGSAKSVGRFVSDFLLLNTVPAAMGYFMRKALRGDEIDDDELLEELAREQLSYLAGQMVVLRELSGVIQGYQGYSGPPGLRAISDVGSAVQQIGQGEADRALFRALNAAAGALFHYPAVMVQRVFDGTRALQQGKTSRPTALIFGAPRD